MQVMKTLISLWSMNDSTKEGLTQSKELDSLCAKSFQALEGSK